MQLSIVEDGVNGSARRYNDLKINNDRKANELKSKLDMLDEIRTEYENMSSMKNRTNPESLRIDSLKEEVCKIEDEIRRAQHYHRQLQHMLDRLHKNKVPLLWFYIYV